MAGGIDAVTSLDADDPAEVAIDAASAWRDASTSVTHGRSRDGRSPASAGCHRSERVSRPRLVTAEHRRPDPADDRVGGDRVRLIDQRLLPGELTMVEATTVERALRAIATLAVRGAPALGAAGAMGVALAHGAAARTRWRAAETHRRHPPDGGEPGVGRRSGAGGRRSGGRGRCASRPRTSSATGASARYGAALVPEGGRVLTHCNAGALACVGYGTALGVIRAAHEPGRRRRCGSTRPGRCSRAPG